MIAIAEGGLIGVGPVWKRQPSSPCPFPILSTLPLEKSWDFLAPRRDYPLDLPRLPRHQTGNGQTTRFIDTYHWGSFLSQNPECFDHWRQYRAFALDRSPCPLCLMGGRPSLFHLQQL